jgi:hypothetical protein
VKCVCVCVCVCLIRSVIYNGTVVRLVAMEMREKSEKIGNKPIKQTRSGSQSMGLTPYQKNARVRYIPIYLPRILYLTEDLGKSSETETSRSRPKVKVIAETDPKNRQQNHKTRIRLMTIASHHITSHHECHTKHQSNHND